MWHTLSFDVYTRHNTSSSNLLDDSSSSAGSIGSALALSDVDPGVAGGGRGPRVQGLTEVLEALVQHPGEEDGHCWAEQLQRVGCHPAAEQDLLAHACVELEVGIVKDSLK